MHLFPEFHVVPALFSMLKGIRYMMSVYPAIGALLAVMAVTLYRIDEKLVSRIETELKERRLIEAKSCPK